MKDRELEILRSIKIKESWGKNMLRLRNMKRTRELRDKRPFKHLCFQGCSYILCYRLETSRLQKSPETKPRACSPV